MIDKMIKIDSRYKNQELTDSQTKLNNLRIELETVEQKIKILESDYDVTKTNLNLALDKFKKVSKTNHVELFT